ncbi:hypothetical protein Ciccas_000877 [Cichlidogyrus casuarinus]|uniref:Uncharacterized protein n=1 Tax=Cichlidogyrus casuarinus TaxID=1844966 RepID=A0ABD2QM28_9PLAT
MKDIYWDNQTRLLMRILNSQPISQMAMRFEALVFLTDEETRPSPKYSRKLVGYVMQTLQKIDELYRKRRSRKRSTTSLATVYHQIQDREKYPSCNLSVHFSFS